MADTITIPYRPSTLMILAGIGFFGGAGILILRDSFRNAKGMLINKIIYLDAHQASVVLAILGLASLAFGLLGLVALISLPRRSPLVLTDATLTWPDMKWLTQRTQVTSLHEFTLIEIKGQKQLRTLKASYPGGRILLYSNLFPKTFPLEAFAAEFVQRVQRAHGQSAGDHDPNR